MPGFGPIGSRPIGAPPFSLGQIDQGRKLVTLTSTAILIAERQTDNGLLVKSYGAGWVAIVRELGNDWSKAFEIDARRWEEILAGALAKEGFKVELTPRSGDHGRDVIAEKSGLIAKKAGIGTIRLLGSMKALGPDYVVTREHVHEMLGVINTEGATLGMIVTTSVFAPRLFDAPGLAAAVSNRLELIDGTRLYGWLRELTSSST
jgi:restriction system protein